MEYESLYLRGSAPRTTLRREVAPLVPDGFEAADRRRSSATTSASQIGSFGRFLKHALQGFALLALFVGGFVIYNTFSVIVAQRLRELAVLAGDRRDAEADQAVAAAARAC